MIPTALLGIGAVGVGAFPLTHPVPHAVRFTAFLAGGLAVVLSARLTAAPFRHLWTVLGAIALGDDRARVGRLPLLVADGRTRRGWPRAWIVYPVVLWLVAFGSYLMAAPAAPAPEGGERPR